MKLGGLVQDIVRGMLMSGLVEEVLAFTQSLDEEDIVPIFITDEKDAQRIVVTSHNPASLAGLVAEYGDKRRKIGVVVRSCDARALIELAKRNQVRIDNIYMIGLECYGTASVDRGRGELYILPGEILVGEETRELDENLLLSNCRRCEYPVPTMADISCRIDKDSTSITINTEKGKGIVAAVNVQAEAASKTDITAVKERAQRWQESDFGELRRMSRQQRLAYWLSQFDKCIKCYGCRNSCPLCYCKDCYLEADRILVKRGEMPPERAFHLTRLIHIGDSCVNCGQCEAACPMEIPISRLYHMLYHELSSIYNYQSGVDVAALPPLGSITEEEMEIRGVDLG